MGLTAYEEILKKENLSADVQATQMLQRVGWRIASAANRPDFSWEFKLIDNDKVANAFCLPGGKVFVYSGILKYTVTEAGLATVVGHEVAHALARHGAERMSLELLSRLGETAIEAAISAHSPEAVSTFQTAYGLAANIGIILPYSRTQEYEADRIGLVLMARAGYDPREAVRFWRRLSHSKNQPSPPAFLSTHPTDEDRIREIELFLPRALAEYKKGAY